MLCETSHDIFESIERTGQQPHEISEIIRSLKEAKREMDARLGKTSERPNKTAKRLKMGLDKASWGPHVKRLWNSLQITLSDTKKGEITNKTIIDAFIQAGLATKARSKEGRQKMVLMIQGSLDCIEDIKRIKVLESVSKILGLSQTEGWMEVIKSKKNNFNK